MSDLVIRVIRGILLLWLVLPAGMAQTTSGWKLVWSDEFNGPAGAPPNPANWNYDLGGGGWGNGEAEVYTNSPNNVFQDGKGNLVIRAIRDSSGNFTSARLQTGAPGASTQTSDLSWQYGRIEARIKLPFGLGVWPAFWILGENIDLVGWPQSGEVDIMENFGTYDNNVSVNNGTAHGPGYSGADGISQAYTLPFGEKVTDDYHVYAIEWSHNSVVWYVDGASYHTVTPSSIPKGDQWVFNAPFFILLNLAIGGPDTFLGTPEPKAPFPDQDMLVDYVRVYQATTVSPSIPVITPGSVMNAASLLGTIAPGSLATLSGENLAEGTHSGAVGASGSFPGSIDGVSVTVNGKSAPLTMVSPKQITFQVPWETAPGTAVKVQVIRNKAGSNVEVISIAATTAPSAFLNDLTNGVAKVNGAGCETTQCAVMTGGVYELTGNGFGPKNSPQKDGVPAASTGSLTPLEVPGSPGSCHLTIGGQTAKVEYCGAGPGQITDQLKFVYPAGVSTAAPYVASTLTIDGVTGRFRVPAVLSADQNATNFFSR
jgi:uncharacterized protein (TIGR03437 family)